MEKKQMRRESLSRINLIKGKERKKREQEMLKILLSDKTVKEAEKIMCFVSFRDEIDTHSFIKSILKEKGRIYVPVIVNGEMLISEIHHFSELKEGYYGILEPEKLRIAPPEEMDLIITPGTVFSKDNYRIGYGGGFYDRLFSNPKTGANKTGICFKEQLVEKIPAEKFDIKVDRVLYV